MKHKSMKVITLAAALAVSMSASALAAAPPPGGGGGGGPKPGEVEANADTTISILTTANTQPNISYTVPLYVTMAVVNDDANVRVPLNYGMTNTTPPNGTAAVPIGVTNMSFEKLAGSTFNTVASSNDVGTDAQNIYLTIGAEKMPALTGASAASIKPSGNIFWDDATKKPKPLTGNVNLPIVGTVAKTTRGDGATAAQFRIKYTVSLLTDKGDPLGAVYAGDDRTAAGLGEWVNPNP